MRMCLAPGRWPRTPAGVADWGSGAIKVLENYVVEAGGPGGRDSREIEGCVSVWVDIVVSQPLGWACIIRGVGVSCTCRQELEYLLCASCTPGIARVGC
jgi:hypothetical protein